MIVGYCVSPSAKRSVALNSAAFDDVYRRLFTVVTIWHLLSSSDWHLLVTCEERGYRGISRLG